MSPSRAFAKRKWRRTFTVAPTMMRSGISAMPISTPHNSMDAFFSGKDDRDERSVGLYFVLGELDHFYPEIKARVFCGDNFVTIDPATVIEGLEQPFPQEWLDQVSVRRPVPVKVEKKT